MVSSIVLNVSFLRSQKESGTCIFAYGLNSFGGRLCLSRNTSCEIETEKSQKAYDVLSLLVIMIAT